MTCGLGYEIWSRKCDSPPPKFGGNCSKHGKDRDSRPCRIKPCPGQVKILKVVKIDQNVNANPLTFSRKNVSGDFLNV